MDSTLERKGEISMRNPDSILAWAPIALLALIALATGCTNPEDENAALEVISTFPDNHATGVSINDTISAKFNKRMDIATMNSLNFTLTDGGSTVTGTVTYNAPNHTVVFAASENLAVNTKYTATVKKESADLGGTEMTDDKVWTFTTSPAGQGPAPVKLGTSGNFVVLAKSGISTVPASVITGDIGLSPAAESFMTGFSQTKATGYSTSPQVVGALYAADMTPPTPINMTVAITDMETAYTDAAGRVTPDFQDLGGGTIGGLTLYPGLYRWGSSVNATSDFTISGGANDVWIFQISGNLVASSGIHVILSGGARAKNVFWQVGGYATLGTSSGFEGIILCQTSIAINTGALLNGRMMSQSEIALEQSTVTEPSR